MEMNVFVFAVVFPSQVVFPQTLCNFPEWPVGVVKNTKLRISECHMRVHPREIQPHFTEVPLYFIDFPMGIENREKICAAARAFLTSEGLRQTSQRNAIIVAAFSTREHFSAEDLLRMARAIEPLVSRATVYRNLPLLIKSGLLRELDLGNGIQYYDPNFIERPIHNHLICVDCDKIIEFEDSNMEVLENCISRRLGFSPANKILRIEGHCDALRLHGDCLRRHEQRNGSHVEG